MQKKHVPFASESTEGIKFPHEVLFPFAFRSARDPFLRALGEPRGDGFREMANAIASELRVRMDRCPNDMGAECRFHCCFLLSVSVGNASVSASQRIRGFFAKPISLFA